MEGGSSLNSELFERKSVLARRLDSVRGTAQAIGRAPDREEAVSAGVPRDRPQGRALINYNIFFVGFGLALPSLIVARKFSSTRPTRAQVIALVGVHFLPMAIFFGPRLVVLQAPRSQKTSRCAPRAVIKNL